MSDIKCKIPYAQELRILRHAKTQARKDFKFMGRYKGGLKGKELEEVLVNYAETGAARALIKLRGDL